MLAVLTGSATLPMLDRQQVVTNGQPWGQPSSPVWMRTGGTLRTPPTPPWPAVAMRTAWPG